MKKILAFITSILLVTTLFIAPAYANKAGVNLGGIWNDKNMEKAGQMVGQGGWITVLSCEVDKLELALAKAPSANIILRLYNGGSIFTPNDAISFVNMLGKLNTGRRKIFVIPWNEPNLPKECGGKADCTGDVNAWVGALKSHIGIAGISDKIVLLSPPLNHTCPTSACMQPQEFAGRVSFNNFDGIALNLYKFATDGSPTPSDVTNYLNALGVSGKPVYIVETGKLDPGVIYDNGTMETFLRAAYANWNVEAIAPLSYDPEPSPSNPWLFGWDGENCGTTCGFIQNYAAHNPGAVAYGGGVTPYTAAGCTGQPDEPQKCKVSAQYCGGMIRSCVPPQTPEKDPCCPLKTSKTTDSGFVGKIQNILDAAANPDELWEQFLGWFAGFASNIIDQELAKVAHITATISYKDIENPGEKVRNLIHGEPALEAENPDEEAGAGMMAYSEEGGGYWGNGLSDFLSLPTDDRNTRELARTKEWKSLVETKFNSTPLGGLSPEPGSPSEINTVVNVFENEPIKYGLDSLGFYKLPEGSAQGVAQNPESNLAQQSVLSAQDASCLPPDTNDTLQDTCESLGVGQTQSIKLTAAVGSLLGKELGFQTIMQIPFAEEFEKAFWGRGGTNQATDEIGLVNIFKLPGESGQQAISNQALPALGKAKATINLSFGTPQFFTDAARIASGICNTISGLPLLGGLSDIVCGISVPDGLTIAETDALVELKYRGMGVMGDLQKIGQKLDFPETSEVAFEQETQNYSSNPVSLASAIGGHALGEHTVSEEEPLTLPEKVGQFLGRIVAKIIIPN